MFRAVIFLLTFLSFTSISNAQVPGFYSTSTVGMRFMGTVNYIEAKDMNGYLNSIGLTDIKRLPGFSIELTGTNGLFELGARANRRFLHVGVDGDVTQSDYTRLTAWSVPFIFRVYLFDFDFFRMDLFGGAGPSWAGLETRKNGYESQYELAFGDLRAMTVAAASLHFGFRYVYLTVESGYEWNKIGSLTRTWQPQAGAMNTIDLYGYFINLGLTARFGGMPGGGFLGGLGRGSGTKSAAPAE